jgi:iron(III) transport system substrate-binding protein
LRRIAAFLSFLLVFGLGSAFADLTIYTSVDEANARKILNAFSSDTGVKVNYVFLSSGPALARIQAEKDNPQADVWFGAPMANHIVAKDQGLTVAYKTSSAAGIDAKFLDADGFFYAFYMNPIGIGVNLDVLKQVKAPVPATFQDLAKPAYKGLIQYPNPQSSGTAYSFLTGLVSVMGEDGAMNYLKALAKNVQSYTQSGTGPSNAVGIGQAAIGIQFTPAFFQYMDKGYAVKVIFPPEGVAYESASVSIIKGTKNAADAHKLVDWILSKKGQQAIVSQKTYFYPVRSDVEFGSLPALSSIKLIAVSEEWAASNKSRLIGRWINEVLPVK